MIKGHIISVLIFTTISLIVLGLNAFPNYYAYINTPADKSFSGQASWFDPWDINVYVSAIKWGQQGNILLANSYTTEGHTPVLMYPIYTLSGYIFPSVPPYLSFYFLAIIFGFLLLITILGLAKIFFSRNFEILIATTLIALGGGVGWLFFPSIQSGDLFITGFTFASHFQRPHEALGIIFYLLSLIFFFKAATLKKIFFNLLSLGALLPLMLFYPYYFLSYALICGFYSLLIFLKNNDKKPFIYVFINASLVIPFILIYLNHLRGSQGFSGVVSQQLNNPDIFQLVLGYGIISIFMVYQAIYLKKDKTTVFLNIWFFSSLLLSFLPFGFSRFYLRALFFPAVILSLLSLELISSKLHLSKKFLISILLVILPLSSFYMSYKRVAEVENNNHWYYLKSTEREALEFLDTKTPKGSGVLASYTMGNYIPANTNNKVYFGHLLQTPDAEEKINNIIMFYSNKFSEDDAAEFVKEAGITYIIFGPEERNITLSNSQSMDLKYKFLHPVFKNPEVIIYTF
ncbi:hypothetical protein A3A14_00170 [Candidatus Daviesbacteria bacterium RIFCSPLOWO2_01_FULL_43_38]|uniref:Glycosyltransferase RgtA/B/C/D-like domain-containing protein n=3 Tax=Candidatus Daviesiibacteriota TaxID=1752718 RepID=A0A1F5K4X3_9BACT|nr:MAG: putative membrane protein [Candidatus Daviesbacteria bacterium GW2011_GWA1_42_6]KKS70951.1 MAG: putative membrane protein [Candidatus Daviesbacteria bacterium GW2011_GWA2_42_7]OGE20011.1 MAG: hypothetical protein A2874_00810 [Candidatus Daviesbacteria bacterium RIFCSPHIGHO2_01_FULL_43_17]OGE35761.1 MAG: hypothetical protein A3E45_00495 [Candidatus Daviesbacteria bacterium RIFCSPHIGHO2_12_FULL_43_11]OGE63446.1 MAG: hypothetical protein A3A14_00170 [Candidatus Daviesbacteria bacterium RIF